MPVLTPYMISFFWILSSSRARHLSMRFLAAGSMAMDRRSRATWTTLSMVRPVPFRVMGMERPPGEDDAGFGSWRAPTLAEVSEGVNKAFPVAQGGPAVL